MADIIKKGQIWIRILKIETRIPNEENQIQPFHRNLDHRNPYLWIRDPFDWISLWLQSALACVTDGNISGLSYPIIYRTDLVSDSCI